MTKEYPRIDLTVDAVVFGFETGKPLSVLLIKRKKEPFKGSWAIPGGFVEVNENLEAAAIRELKEETGIDIKAFEQLYAFGDPHRDPRKRVVSIAHYTLIHLSGVKPEAGDDAAEVEWFPTNELPPLAFDHGKILTKAKSQLQEALEKGEAGYLKAFKESAVVEITSRLRST